MLIFLVYYSLLIISQQKLHILISFCFTFFVQIRLRIKHRMRSLKFLRTKLGSILLPLIWLLYETQKASYEYYVFFKCVFNFTLCGRKMRGFNIGSANVFSQYCFTRKHYVVQSKQ